MESTNHSETTKYLDDMELNREREKIKIREDREITNYFLKNVPEVAQILRRLKKEKELERDEFLQKIKPLVVGIIEVNKREGLDISKIPSYFFNKIDNLKCGEVNKLIKRQKFLTSNKVNGFNGEQIKEEAKQYPIEELCIQLGIEINNRNKGICPLHQEKTPSFSINKEKNVWYCFGCSEGGDTIQLVMKVLNKTFQDSLKFLTKAND